MSLPDNCTKPTDFPTEWKIKPPKRQKCRLSTHVDDESQLLIVAKGVCPTGWVKERDVQFFCRLVNLALVKENKVHHMAEQSRKKI